MLPEKLYHLFNCINIAAQTKYLTTNQKTHNYRSSNFCLAVDGRDYFWRSIFIRHKFFYYYNYSHYVCQQHRYLLEYLKRYQL